MICGSAGEGQIELILEKTLDKNPIALAVEGSRRFREPKNLGMMPYQGAHVLVFKNDLRPIMASLEKAALRIEEIAGNPVAVFRDQREEDLWTTYVAQPKPNVMILATDRDYLQEVLSRIASKVKSRRRALPKDLPEWKYVDGTASFWGLRHYDRKDAADDPSSPLAGEKRQANTPDDQAIGLVIALKDDIAKIHYLSTNKDALGIAEVSWAMVSHKGQTHHLHAGSTSVIKISFPLENDSSSNDLLLLVLLQALGHGVEL